MKSIRILCSPSMIRMNLQRRTVATIFAAQIDAHQHVAFRAPPPPSISSSRPASNVFTNQRRLPLLDVCQKVSRPLISQYIRPPAVFLSTSKKNVPHHEIKIELGFEETDRDSLVEICWQAFHAKSAWIYKNNKHKEKEIMRALLQPETTIVARANDKIVGFLAFKTGQNDPVNKSLRDVMRRHRNWRSVFFLLLAHKPRKDELYMFLMAVTAEARGSGIGTRLMRKAYEIAKERGLRCATLHVIDENRDARRLYVREGFVDEKRLRLPWFVPHAVFSFRAAWFQRKAL